MLRGLLLLTIALIVSSCSSDRTEPVTAPQFAILGVGPETQVTTDPADQFDPEISGSLVVYSDRRAASADIWVHDVVTGVAAPIPNAGEGDQLLGDVSGTLVVFNDYSTGNANIWVCEWTGTTCPGKGLSSHPANQRRPAVFDSLIVYEDDRNGNYDIYLWDLRTNTEVQITTHASHQRKPEIFGTRVVWEDVRAENADVYTCEWNGTSCVDERPVTNHSAQDMDPEIFGDWVVFGSNRASVGDIYAVNLAADDWTPIALTSGADYERNPGVSGTYVAYESYATGDAGIHLHDLATGTSWVLTTDPAEQYLHAISGTRVVYTDNRNDNLDIYMVELTEGDVPAIDDIHEVVDGFVADGSISNYGIGNALHAFLDQIADAIAGGDHAAACSRLAHFIEFVAKKAGKQIDTAAADELIALAQGLVAAYCSE